MPVTLTLRESGPLSSVSEVLGYPGLYKKTLFQTTKEKWNELKTNSAVL